MQGAREILQSRALWATVAYAAVACALYQVLNKDVSEKKRKALIFFCVTWLVWLFIFVCFIVGAGMEALTTPRRPRKKD